MASFKVGDRVRILEWPIIPTLVGREGSVVKPLGIDDKYPERVGVSVDGHPGGARDGLVYFLPRRLAPLTPPAEDAWAADAVRKVTKPRPEFTTLRELLEAR